MREFRHLSKSQISELISLHLEGLNQAAIALRLEVDPSTVSNHLKRYNSAYPEERSLYASLKAKARKVCIHPSGRCTLCGEMWDELRRTELVQVATLQSHLRDALSRLKVAGVDVKSLPYNGINDTR
jgi:IS30 family transposase